MSTALVLCCAGCNTPQPATPPPAPATPDAAPKAKATPSPGTQALADAAKTYTKDFERITRDGAWAHTLCRPAVEVKPSGPAASGLRLGPPEQEGREVPHMRKLYWLYASDADFYSGMRVRAAQAPPKGFSIVKEAWTPAKLDKANPPAGAAKNPHARWGDGEWYGTERASLFVMHYTGDAKAPGTDAGWVYGVASPDGSKLLESGKLDACANCHKSAGPHRLYGL